MLYPWNDTCLQPPPINTFLVKHSIDIADLSYTCKNIKKILTQQTPLQRECALLSRFIYKFDKKFRSDIGYRNLKKVYAALQKYMALNLLKDVERFLSVMPSNRHDDYLPTRQMLEHLLVRIISFSKFMLRINVCSKVGAIYYMDRVKRGESHWMSLMPFALLSRIWSISQILLQHSNLWYSHLYNYIDKLQSKGLEFLPKDYILPEDLNKYLDLNNLECHGRFDWFQKKNINMTFDIVDDEDVELNNLLNYVKEINKDDEEMQEIVSSDPVSSNVSYDPIQLSIRSNEKNIDEGESISREHFQSFFKQSTTLETELCITHSADAVTNKKTLNDFISKEESYRNENKTESLSKHLSFMQWQSLKKSLNDLRDSLSNNRKIQRKFTKIWKEKCTDYLND